VCRRLLLEERELRDVGSSLSARLRGLKTYRLGLLASELARTVLATVKEIKSLDKRFLSLQPQGPCRGRVLLCYENKGFFLKPGERMPNDHTNRWESVQIARSFLDLGYEVDVISENNDWFVPTKPYSFFVGNRINFDRIADSINRDCVKILHIDASHWLFHNTAEHERLVALQRRRGLTLPTRRSLMPNLAIEHADYATILGNEFTLGTYAYAQKPLYRLSISSSALYPWPEDKDFAACRNHFVWLGSYGFVHKGLDLVLEAFAQMPEHHLTVCGPIDEEKDFKNAYGRELYGTPNIHTAGWVDVESPEFLKICRRCVGLIYPSCSEGQCGGVVTCMHAGLIPIVSRQSGVDVKESFGLVLKDCSIDEIKASVKEISRRPAQELQRMARIAWEFARANHTRERFAEEYRKSISAIMALAHRDQESAVKKGTPIRSYPQAASVSDTRAR
jgi:glycosyltransferase involved in cell wall biosynthesis